MLYLSAEGVPIAKLVGGKYNNKVVPVSGKTVGDSKDFKFLGIANDAKFQPVPNSNTERQIVYTTGPSGGGKSTFARKYLEEYTTVLKDNPSTSSRPCLTTSHWTTPSPSA